MSFTKVGLAARDLLRAMEGSQPVALVEFGPDGATVLFLASAPVPTMAALRARADLQA